MMDNSAARGMPDYSVGSTPIVKKSTPLFVIKRLTFPFFALLALLAVGTLSLLAGGLVQAQDAAIQYPENGTGPVATYTAVDPEGADITSWTLAGADADDFMIDGGVLTFMKSPDYEMATDGDRNNDGDFSDTGDVASDNTYSVTVQATDETNKVGMHEVTVEVTNVDEPGTVTLSALQPQAGTMLTATHSDPDGTISDLKRQWAKSMTMDGTYEDIDKATSSAYTPKDVDIDYYLRVTVSYTDPEGEGKTAMATSAYAVQGLRSKNNAPEFADDQDPVMDNDQEDAARKVAENTPAGSAIGDPVVAEDADGDILTYTLEGDVADSFDIDWATGQLKTKAPLDAEGAGHTDTDSVTDGFQLKVIVRATDPAGIPQALMCETDDSEDSNYLGNCDTVTVIITITDVNEPPAVTGMDAVTFVDEGMGDITTPLDTYMEDNPEDDNVDSTWSVAGADGSKFEIDEGALIFKDVPDYEAPTDANTDNIYEVTVRAADADGNIGMRAVKVTVENAEEPGMVTLSKIKPRVGVAVTASVTDPDGSISGLTWQWSIDGADPAEGVTATPNGAITGATSDTYTPKAGDVDGTLTATASYFDGQSAPDTAKKPTMKAADNPVATDTRNKAPVFDDQDTVTDGVQNTETTRKVEENAEALATDDAADNAGDGDDAADNVGGVVTATDPDPNADPLTYTLEGTDAAKFRVRDNGQIEVGAGTKLDYETKRTYMVTVMAEDSFGDSASIMVTINVTDLNEGPDITGEDTIEYPENRTSSVETYRASDPERAGTITWSLTGTDAALFDISSNGVLTFKKSPDYEAAADVIGTSPSTAGDNMYEVIVQATDADRKMATKPVTVEVTNVDEPGVVSLSARQPMAGVLLTATLTDPDSVTTTNPTGLVTTGVEWQWQKGSSNILNADDETYTPDDPDQGSYLRATVTYKDPESGRDRKRANVRSDHVVLRAATGNNAPEFADDQDPVMDNDQEDAARKVAENTEAGEKIGAPVRATDADSGQKLTYTLEGTDEGFFDIDWATGQIMTKDELDAEARGGDNTYAVTVRATDPTGDPKASSADNSDTVMVEITVTDVNEPPAIKGNATATFLEMGGAIDQMLAAYTADDPERTGVDSTWSVAGADGSKFNIGNESGGILGQLKFKVKPDYEMPTDANTDNVYEVTVRAADADGYIGTLAVKVTVTNEDELGVVTLSKIRPRVGIAVTASVTDPDGSISGLTWQWYDDIIESGLETNAIEGANSDSYTPVAGDIGETLWARASYTDAEEADKSASGGAGNPVAADTRNRAPVFDDQDTETDGVQNEATERKVEENAKAVDDSPDAADDNVGGAVTADDPDPNSDALTYTLEGADAASFTVRQDDPMTEGVGVDEGGQIEVGAGTKLDYETKQTYTVTVRAADSYGESDTIMVTITVTDMDEAPTIMVGGLAVTGQSAIDYAENSTGMVAAYGAVGPDAAMATWSLDGDDAGDFRISTAGVLTFRTSPNYESPADADGDNVYEVTVTANDGENTTTRDVTITVTDVEEEESADPLLTEYDPNGDGVIETADMRLAVANYFGPSPTLTKADMRRLVRIYFTQ